MTEPTLLWYALCLVVGFAIGHGLWRYLQWRRDNWYIGKKIEFNGEVRTITKYDPTVKTATVRYGWDEAPNNDDEFRMKE